MSNGAKQEVSGSRFLLRFIPELWNAESVERVYGLMLDAAQEILKHDRAFVALTECKNPAPNAQEVQPGRLHELAFTINATGKLMGRVILQFEEFRSFSDDDIDLLELFAMEVVFVILHFQNWLAYWVGRTMQD